MAETARLVIAVDSRQVGQSATDLARLGKTSSAVEKEFKTLTATAARLAQPLAGAFPVKAANDAAQAYSALSNSLQRVAEGTVSLAAAQTSGLGFAGIVGTISQTLENLKTATEGSTAALSPLGKAFDSVIVRGEGLAAQVKLLSHYKQQQAELNTKIISDPENVEVYRSQLISLGKEYETNSAKLTLWNQAVDVSVGRLDGLFAKAWADVGSGADTLWGSLAKGADTLWDNLVIGAKQAFGEIAHMLTTKPLLASIRNWLTGTDDGQGLGSVWSRVLGGSGQSSGGGLSGLFGGSDSSGGGWSSFVSLGKNLYSTWNNLSGAVPSIMSGYASGGFSGAISNGVGYYGNMLTSLYSTVTSGFTSLLGETAAITGASAATTAATTAAMTGITAEVALSSAATVGAEGITAATLSGAVAEGAATVGTNIGIAGATTAAATQGLGAQISAALGNAAAMWPLAVIMGMYQSGKLYSAGVRPDAGETWDSAGNTALGKAAMLPATLQSKAFEITDAINSKLVGGKLAAIISGSTLHQAVWGAVGKKLFGSGYQTKDSGVALGVESGKFDASGYIKQKKKGGLISGSSKTRFLQTDLPDELSDSLGERYNETILTALSNFHRLNVTVNEGILENLNMATQYISTQGRTEEQINTAFETWFTDLGRSVVSTISDATSSGVGEYSLVQLTEFVDNLFSVNEMFKLLNINALPVSVWGGKLTEQYVAMAGGLEKLMTASTSYYNAFFSETERADDTLSAVNKQFESADLTLPDSRDGFRSLVESIDSTTDAGRAMFFTLMNLSGSAASAYSILEQRAADAKQATLDLAQALKDGLMGTVGTASSALTRAVEAERKQVTEAYNARVTSLEDMASTASQSVSDLTSHSGSLENAMKALNGTSDETVKTLRAQAQATLQSALLTARAGGSLSGLTGLDDALDTVSSNNTDVYSSLEDFARDQGRTANVVAELNAINGKQLTSAEQTAKTLDDQLQQARQTYEDQMKAFEGQLEFAQAQLDAINGVDNSIMSVTDAVNAMNAAVIAALGTVKSATATNAGTLIDTVYKDVLGRPADDQGKKYWQGQVSSGALAYDQLAGAIKNAAIEDTIKSAYKSVLDTVADAEGAKYWADQVASGALSIGQLKEAISNAAKANGSIPMYSAGGDFNGGMRLVGENGPELEVTGPSRIFNASQTVSMLKGAGDNGTLESRVDVLIDVVKQILGPMKLNSDADSKLFKKWDRVGLPTTQASIPA